MAFEIAEKLSKSTTDLYFDPKFRNIVEDHLSILKTSGITITPIEMQLFWKYEGNFYGFLTEYGIKKNLHWIYLRVNDMHHPNEFAKAVRDPLDKPYNPFLVQPSDNLIDTLVKYYMSSKD